MSRITTFAGIEAAPAAAQPLLNEVKKSLGSVPNLFRLVANSPAALEGLLSLRAALGKGSIDAATGERIALAIANVNGCTYCNSAHSYIAKNLTKLSDAEIAANRNGGSSDPKADAAVRFAVKVARERGAVTDDDVRHVKLAGFSDAQLVEIVAHVALNTLTNAINEVFKTEVDFPVAVATRAA
ncbi:MAG: carboxymuconolactone decarboxylase family protein [Alphaproteobacteria bacterium]|nr:carboxymuconolactone decarboxylase family protein [Alphaproteobacteria bacterium]